MGSHFCWVISLLISLHGVLWSREIELMRELVLCFEVVRRTGLLEGDLSVGGRHGGDLAELSTEIVFLTEPGGRM